MSKHYVCKCNKCETIMFDENPSDNLVEIDNIKEPIDNMMFSDDHWVCPKCDTDAYLVDYVEDEKEFVGIVCDHTQKILDDEDAYNVEFKDCCGDVCEDCFAKYSSIKNECDMTEESKSPYKGNKTDYWYDGTLEEFKSEIDNADELTDTIIDCMFSDVDAYAESMKGLLKVAFDKKPQLVQEYKEWFNL